MKKRSPGCLSANGLFSVAITLLVFGSVYLVKGGILFSPGSLSISTGELDASSVRSHAETGSRCSACHAPFWGLDTMTDRCLVCHTAVEGELSDPTSFHGTLVVPNPNVDCRECHTEHQGPEANLTDMDASRFQHQVTGFSLMAHTQFADGSKFACQDCHENRGADFDQETCVTCHQQDDRGFITDHLAAFGWDCLACHDGIDSYGASFDHILTEFPLEGQHAIATCDACHVGARTGTDLRVTPLDCYACHAQEDNHEGAFGQDCSQCHTPDGWEQVSFHHNLTGFILLGKHTEISCLDCHEGGVFTGTPKECSACHAMDDIHDGQLGEDCSRCHISSDWARTTFDHNQTAFPLTGAHNRTECTQCHTTGAFRGTPQSCNVCHTEPSFHAGLFETNCARCHTTEAWRPAQFGFPHSFPLNHGRQGGSSCQTCHSTTLLNYTCFGCHEHDPGEIEEEHRKEGIADYQNCIHCHPTGLKDEFDDD